MGRSWRRAVSPGASVPSRRSRSSTRRSSRGSSRLSRDPRDPASRLSSRCLPASMCPTRAMCCSTRSSCLGLTGTPAQRCGQSTSPSWARARRSPTFSRRARTSSSVSRCAASHPPNRPSGRPKHSRRSGCSSTRSVASTSCPPVSESGSLSHVRLRPGRRSCSRTSPRRASMRRPR